LLVASGLGKRFGGVTALRDVSFAIAPGETVAIIGPNGAGKTTCFNVIHGELAPDRGDVRVAGRSIVGLPPHAIARLGVGRTFQVAATFASMTVRESVALALVAHDARDAAAFPPLLDLQSSRIDELLLRLHIDALAGVHCAALAYGDAKRLELALALAGEPRLLLMDEPTAGMSPRSRRELMQLVTDLAARDDVAVLFTEHDMDIVFAFADRVLVLDRGALIASGPPAEIRADARVRAVYLGLDEPPLISPAQASPPASPPREP
jgi:branched-chain amino acid transport system ATP-binding protein